jgi:predicted DNA binding protein
MAQSLQLEVRLPEGHWAGDLTRLFPQAMLRIEDHMALGKGRGSATATIRCRDTSTVHSSINSFDSIMNVIVLEQSKSGGRFRVEIAKGGGGFLKALRKIGLTPKTPFEIRDGWVEWSIECDQNNARNLIEELNEDQIPHKILSIKSKAGESLLTERQRQVFELALAEGYFDKPRRISQTNMSEILNISKSTFNEILQSMSSKIMNEFAAEIRKR